MSLIPLTAIPVSLIGTFGFMDLFGFSINNISLFGIALAIGIVVDNAIVIVENVERNMKLGMDVKKATKDTMDHVQNALIAITLVLSAVFVPTAFVEGISGQFYKQFALTIAVSTILSGVVSLTLSPALCVMLIKNNGEKPDLLTRIMNFLFGKFFKIFNRSFGWVSEKYGKAVHGIVRHWVLVIFTYVILLGLTGYLFSITPSGFIPKQDNDFLQISVQMPDGYSLGQTDKVMKRMQELLKEIDGIEKFMCVVGLNGATRTKSPDTGALFVKMDPKLERMRRGQDMLNMMGAISNLLQPDAFNPCAYSVGVLLCKAVRIGDKTFERHFESKKDTDRICPKALEPEVREQTGFVEGKGIGVRSRLAARLCKKAA